MAKTVLKLNLASYKDLSKIEKANCILLDIGLSQEEIDKLQYSGRISMDYHTPPDNLMPAVKEGKVLFERLISLLKNTICVRDCGDEIQNNHLLATHILADLSEYNEESCIEAINDGRVPYVIDN